MSTQKSIICEPGILREFQDRNHYPHAKIDVYQPNIIPWQDFEDSVNAFSIDETPNTFVNQFLESTAHSFANESGLKMIFLSDFALRLLPFGIVINCEHVRADIVLEGPKNRKVIGEIKYFEHEWTDIYDLCLRFEQECASGSTLRPHASHAIRQLYTLMRSFNANFGFLSNHRRTWFVRRKASSPTTLEISPNILCTGSSPSVSQCLWYTLNTEEDRIRVIPPEEHYQAIQEALPSSSNPRVSDHSDYEPNSSSSNEDSSPPASKKRKNQDFENLQHFQSNEMWKECMLDGLLQDVPCTALRCNQQELTNILESMNQLENLQGSSIPKLLGHGYICNNIPAIVFERIKIVELEKMGLNEKASFLICLKKILDLKIAVYNLKFVYASGKPNIIFRKSKNMATKQDIKASSELARAQLFGKEN